MLLENYMAQSGYIYVLYNPSANGVVKIGKTQRNPDERAKELSSATGVPTPFVVVYQSLFQDCDKAELFIHTRLDKYRLSENREFFQLPIYLAIDTVLEAKKILDESQNILYENNNSNDEYSEDFLDLLPIEESIDPGSEILEAADAYYYGLGDTIQDFDEAFNLYQKAARLGSTEAFLQLGCMCRDGEGRYEDNSRALEFFKEGIKHGNDECWAEMAKLYHSEGHKSNEEKCWSKYFSSKNFINFSFRRNPVIYDYVQNCLLDNSPIVYKEQIIQVREATLEYINRLKEDVERLGTNASTVLRCLWAIKKLS
jgi:tetratricopeptide (TPR) repeat protein